MTTIYLVRHSVRMKKNLIEENKTNLSEQEKIERIVLSPLGEERAKLLSTKSIFDNVDKIYTSNCVRTLETAKYLMERLNLGVTIDDRFDERRLGIPNDKEYPNWFEIQFKDENFKTVGGESQKEVRERMSEAIDEILTNDKNKEICIFTHGYAILYYLMKHCEFIYHDKTRVELIFNNKTIFNRYLNAPEVIKLSFNNKRIKDIEFIEFEDIDYNLGV